MRKYSNFFFDEQEQGSSLSAEAIVPLVLQLIQPKSVVDLGCGLGTWLAVFRENGITDILGVDGDYIDRSRLHIPVDQFLPADLTQPFHIDRQFGLVVSLEVAEHLPVECAETFVKSLVRLGPIVLFSAAVPGQGTTHHLNEQWPDYWHKHFQREGYVVLDALRKKIWRNEYIDFWYRQNILMFVKDDYLATNELLQKEYQQTNLEQLSLVHPELHSNTPGLKQLLPALPAAMKKAVQRRARQLGRLVLRASHWRSEE